MPQKDMSTRYSQHGRVQNRIWKHRHIMDYSQKQLALLLGYARTSQISKWEHGKKLPTLKNALSLARILQVPVEALFAGLAAEIENEHTRRSKKLNSNAACSKR